ncbi:hypothetical protein Taro_031776 [Colocasia esculenta]|uniref:ABC1 atypical kinase-like domain-containing protein n=1 Tax=Colocasia esculenta TaxID=4460 RepID=A0A843W1X0_COLES|nr:hypothetical protein [Colocasia esculenta]
MFATALPKKVYETDPILDVKCEEQEQVVIYEADATLADEYEVEMRVWSELQDLHNGQAMPQNMLSEASSLVSDSCVCAESEIDDTWDPELFSLSAPPSVTLEAPVPYAPGDFHLVPATASTQHRRWPSSSHRASRDGYRLPHRRAPPPLLADLHRCAAELPWPVHRAVLHNGEKVVVKVQRPGLKRLFDIDLQNLKLVAEYFQRSETFGGPTRDWIGIYDECSKILYEEIDYINEGKNADRFRRDFRNIKWVRVPLVIWDYTSTKVLTLEYVPGPQAEWLLLLRKQRGRRPESTRVGPEAMARRCYSSSFNSDLQRPPSCLGGETLRRPSQVKGKRSCHPKVRGVINGCYFWSAAGDCRLEMKELSRSGISGSFLAWF